jgi:hypothetical protein
MIKNLKSYVCLTLLVSSFGSFADTLPCKQAAADLIQSIIDKKTDDIQSEIAKFNTTYPNSPRCLGYVTKVEEEIKSINEEEIKSINEMKERFKTKKFMKLSYLKENILNGNFDPEKNHTTPSESAPKAEQNSCATAS